MKTYSASMARADLPAIMSEVQEGLMIQITRRGEPVALIISATECADAEQRRPTFGEACADFLARFGVDGLGLDRKLFRILRDQCQSRTVTL